MEGAIQLASSSGDNKSVESGSVASVSKSGQITLVKLVNPKSTYNLYIDIV